MVARVAAALAVVLLVGCARGAEERLRLPAGEAFAVTTTLGPRTSVFGDTLTAGIRVLMDRRRVNPDDVKVSYGFRPYSDTATIERVDSGSLTALLYRVELRCLTLFCVPPEGGLVLGDWGVRITSGTAPVQDAAFPDVIVVSRMGDGGFVPENAGEGPDQWPPSWRAAVELPPPSYRASPGLLALLLGAAGLLLLAGAAAAAWSLLFRGRLLRRPETPPLERALAALRDARTDEERRAALEALALALEAEELSEPARALAWSASTPSAAAAEELAALAEGRR